MRRRNFLGQAAIGAGAIAAVGACTPTASNNTATDTGEAPAGDLSEVEWRMATSWPQSLDTIYGGAETVARRVSEMTGDRFRITPFAAGEIVGGLEVLDAVQSGAVECGHTASYYYIGKSAALGFGSSVPFGLNAQQQNAWLYHGGGLEAMQKVYSDFNIINFPAGNTGGQMGGWFKREVKTANDLNGLKMRIPGLGGQVMERLGVNVQVLPGSDIFLALERGAIDAAEFVGPYDDEKLGLQNAAEFYYYPGWWEPGTTLEIQINLDAWNELHPQYQEILKTATYEANLDMLSKYDALNQQALQRLQGGGTKLTAFSDEILMAAQQEAFALYDETASQDAVFKEVYTPWKEFRDNVYNWNRINELSFDRFVSEARE